MDFFFLVIYVNSKLDLHSAGRSQDLADLVSELNPTKPFEINSINSLQIMSRFQKIKNFGPFAFVVSGNVIGGGSVHMSDS